MKNVIASIIILFMSGMAGFSYAQDVKINANLVVESDGTMRMDAGAMVWDDLRVPLSEPSTGTVKPTWAMFPFDASGSQPFLNWFKDSGVDEMYFVVQMPHSWKEGTDIMPHIHWVPSQNGAAGPTVPRWALQYSWINIGETHTGYTTKYGTTTEPSEILIKNRQYLTPLGTISGSGKTISSMLICRIYRDGSATEDTYVGLAGALEFDFHYQINTLGSRSEYTKGDPTK